MTRNSAVAAATTIKLGQFEHAWKADNYLHGHLCATGVVIPLISPKSHNFFHEIVFGTLDDP